MNFERSLLGRKGIAAAVAGIALTQRKLLISENESEDLTSGQVVGYAVGSVALITISGLAAGLILGLLSIDKGEYQRASAAISRLFPLVFFSSPFLLFAFFSFIAILLVSAVASYDCRRTYHVHFDLSTRLILIAVAVFLASSSFFFFFRSGH